MAAPNDAVAHYNLGCVLTSSSKIGDAELHFLIAAAIDPSFAEASFNAAHIRRLKGDDAGEARFLEQALEADPDYIDALVCLARWHIARDAYTEVGRLLERIERVGTTTEHAEFVLKASLLCRLANSA